ncbi:MAG: hypothetical protein ACYSUI_07330 [Planctomycetota bacterium]|jgi:hypothetical protein
MCTTLLGGCATQQATDKPVDPQADQTVAHPPAATAAATTSEPKQEDAGGGSAKPAVVAAKSEPRDRKAAIARTSAKAQPDATRSLAQAQPTLTAQRDDDQPQRDAPPTATGPQPRWVCTNQTVTLDPVWRGQPLDYNFQIRNEGTADLRIALRRR